MPYYSDRNDTIIVTPLAGVWIEMPYYSDRNDTIIVTPLAGVWIEIFLPLL